MVYDDTCLVDWMYPCFRWDDFLLDKVLQRDEHKQSAFVPLVIVFFPAEDIIVAFIQIF